MENESEVPARSRVPRSLGSSTVEASRCGGPIEVTSAMSSGMSEGAAS
jgi:hypothetical protein